MFPFIDGSDVPVIVSRLQGDINHLLQINNHAFYLGRTWPETSLLTAQISNWVSVCLDDLGKTLKELNPDQQKVIDMKLFKKLTVADLFEIANLESSRERIIEVWRQIENRKAEILRLAQQRRGT